MEPLLTRAEGRCDLVTAARFGPSGPHTRTGPGADAWATTYRRTQAGKALRAHFPARWSGPTGSRRGWASAGRWSSMPRWARTGAPSSGFRERGSSISTGHCPTTPDHCPTRCPTPTDSPRSCAPSAWTTPTPSSSTTLRASTPARVPGGCCERWASTGPRCSTVACPPGPTPGCRWRTPGPRLPWRAATSQLGRAWGWSSAATRWWRPWPTPPRPSSMPAPGSGSPARSPSHDRGCARAICRGRSICPSVRSSATAGCARRRSCAPRSQPSPGSGSGCSSAADRASPPAC